MKKKNTGLRIISGIFKNRRITVVNKKELRPTTNQVRETLFNWLNNKIEKSNCLDCFSGSGTLAIEAISRKANTVTVLEIDKYLVNQIKSTIKKLNISKIDIFHTNTLTWLKKKNLRYCFS